METRQITQIKTWLLLMNNMRCHSEQTDVVAASYDKEKLIEWYNSYVVESYVNNGSPSFEVHGDSHQWNKSFKVGSPLEWYNPIESFDKLGFFGHGIAWEWVTEGKLRSDILLV